MSSADISPDQESPKQQGTQSPQNQQDQKSDKPRKRMSARAGFVLRGGAVLALVLLAGWFFYHETRGKYIESTDDAYIHADNVTVSPKVSGYVEQVYVADNQEVKAGQSLVRIDPRDYSAQSAQFKAQIDASAASVDAARASLQEQKSAIAQAQAQVASAQEDARFARSEVERYQPLAASGAETREKLNSLRNQATLADANVAARRAALEAAQLRVNSMQAQIRQAQAQGENAQAQFDAANVNLAATELKASTDGRIGDKGVRVGQFVSAGTRLMSVVPSSFYVVANFKETQIGLMRIGQPATVKIDALPGEEFQAHVESISPGTGAQFSLLPPQNATGNFTKIVQRVPVRIAVDVGPQLRRLFVAGMSVTAEVNTIDAKDDLKNQRNKDQANRQDPPASPEGKHS
ncbi:HlyD family secretion protein [Herbaspirillum lusitanum]|uniref:HlyD family secretion protein n=1 Tax=Herbaspirillum lusitanum TaxID=213312 RepID=A0ABW9A5G0_9BURK